MGSFIYILFILLFLLPFSSANQGLNTGSVKIAFLIAPAGQGQAQTCVRSTSKLQPFNMDNFDFNWNLTTMTYVVEQMLYKKVYMQGNSPGINGCCAPGLWCKGDYCFTQSFGPKFMNYGWLPNDNTSAPVFTCSSPSLVGANLNITSVTSDSSGQLTMSGRGFGTDAGSLKVETVAQSCGNVQLCNCKQCSDVGDCPTGSACYPVSAQSNSANSGSKYCFPVCTGINDRSCPCNQACSSQYDSAGVLTSLCLPTDMSKYLTTCINNRIPDTLTCSAIPSLLSATQYNVYNTEISTSTLGDYYRLSGSTINTYTCSLDSQCYDGNICTKDACVSGNCVYTRVSGCSSTQQTVREQYTPYNYYSLYMNATSSQTLFKSQMMQFGSLVIITSSTSTNVQPSHHNTNSSNSGGDDDDSTSLASIQHYDNDNTTASGSVDQMSWNFLFFGNLINTFQITNYGAIALPPVGYCTSRECLLFSSPSNVISPWFDPKWASGNVYKFIQSKKQVNKAIRGVVADAYHVLYTNMQFSGDEESYTFSSSVYRDGSIRFSYFDNVSVYSAYSSSPRGPSFFGLWGSFASLSSSAALRYYKENSTQSYLQAGIDTAFCPFNSTACVPETCLAAGASAVIRWNGTLSCTALQPDYNLSISCVWFGGLASTPARVTKKPSTTAAYGEVTCTVPSLNVTDGSVVPFALVFSAIATSSAASPVSFTASSPGRKTVYGVTFGTNNEVARTNLMIRYYNNAPPSTCGCSPFTDYPNYQCNSVQGVCSPKDARIGVQVPNILDCAGTPFGSAYVDSCNNCAGGYTGVTPSFNCNISSSSELFSLLTQTIILLMIICCMTFITSSVSYSIRRMLNSRNNNDVFFLDADIANQFFEANRDQQLQRRGLTEFEMEAIGQITFTEEFYQKYLSDKKKKELEEEHKEREKEKDQNLKKEGSSSSKIKKEGLIGDDTPIDFSKIEEGKVQGEQDQNQNLLKAAGIEGSAESCECSICLMDIEEGSVCRVLPEPCGHIFHLSCIDTWFQQSSQCPLCKRSMRSILEGNIDAELHTTSHLPLPNGPLGNRDVIQNNGTTTIRYITPYRIHTTEDGDEEIGILLTTFTRIPSSSRRNSANNNSTIGDQSNHSHGDLTTSAETTHQNPSNITQNEISPSRRNMNRGFMSLIPSSTSTGGGTARGGFIAAPGQDPDEEEEGKNNGEGRRRPHSPSNQRYNRIVVPRSRSSSFDADL
eukprot:gene6655-7170_t